MLGIFGYDHIDKSHIKVCKNLLGVRAQSPNVAVYGDLGRFPLSVIAKERSVKYWLKLLSSKNSLKFKIFQSQIEGFDAHVQPSRFRHKRYWAEGIKCLLDELRFSHFWLNQDFDHAMNLLGTESETILHKVGTLLLAMLLNWHIIANLKQNLNWRSIMNAFQTVRTGRYASMHIIWKLSWGVTSMFRGRTGFAASARWK